MAVHAPQTRDSHPAASLADRQLYLIGCAGNPASQAGASAETLGFKAWNLLQMAEMGLPVPAAFVLGTQYAADKHWQQQATQPGLWRDALTQLEQTTAKRLGDARRPLLLSVRSGAPVSMPGMMETLLNIGLCDATVDGFIRQTGNPRLVWDAYRRLVQGFGEVVAGIPAERFEAVMRLRIDGASERDLDFSVLRDLSRDYLALYLQHTGTPFPQSAVTQLQMAISAVLKSWHSDKARHYRQINHLDDSMGTAVTIQAMVFGNAGGHSGSGVGFSRDPINGANQLWVDFLFNAQGEDVVSGRRSAHGQVALGDILPDTWQQLVRAVTQLEKHFKDMQDFEFTVENGRLFLLQTRTGKRTPNAAARIALDLCAEGLISKKDARERLAQIPREQLLEQCLVRADDTAASALTSAIPASRGICSGRVALDEKAAQRWRAKGEPVVLVRQDAETRDIDALDLAAGLLTRRGARTSHAAVVARQLGKVCLVGCDQLQLDLQSRQITLADTPIGEGDWLTLDGNAGQIYAGQLQVKQREDTALLERIDALVKPDKNQV